MKIGYFADGPWSHKGLEKITGNENFKISFIVPRFDAEDPILRVWAEKLKVDYLPIKNVNDAESIERLKAYNADLFVSMSFNQIFKKQILKAAQLGFINCHAGALPFYRGRNILNWALINDEKNFSVTVHYIDEEIDTGDIIKQRIAEITDKDDYSTLLSRATDLCAELLYESIVEIEKGTVRCFPQSKIHPVGFYCGRRIEGDEWIDWNWSSRRIFNFVRAITKPGPCARTMLDNQKIIVNCVSLIDDAPVYIGTPGEVVGFDSETLIVKTGDSTIRVESLSFEPPRTPILTNQTIKKIRRGHRFGLNLGKIVVDLQQRIFELENIIKIE